jgi:hypothetical protein
MQKKQFFQIQIVSKIITIATSTFIFIIKTIPKAEVRVKVKTKTA